MDTKSVMRAQDEAFTRIFGESLTGYTVSSLPVGGVMAEDTTIPSLWTKLTPEIRALHGLRKCESDYCNDGVHNCQLPGVAVENCELNGNPCEICDGRGFMFGDNS